jgi:hypothetical protein
MVLIPYNFVYGMVVQQVIDREIIGFIELILDKNGWKAELSDLFVQHSLPSGNHDSLTRKTEVRQPSSGWNTFVTNLFELKILSLPDFKVIQSSSDKQRVIMDGCGIIVEIGTKRAYRVYSYETPDAYVEYWQVKNVIAIIRLIEDEFQIKNKMPVYTESKKVNSDSIIVKEVIIQQIDPKVNNQ